MIVFLTRLVHLGNSWNFMNSKFINWKFTNDISCMLIHKIWNIICSVILSISLYMLPNSTLPNCTSRCCYLAILLNWLHLLPSSLCNPNCKVNNAWSPSSCCLVIILKLLTPHDPCNIAKSKFTCMSFGLTTHTFFWGSFLCSYHLLGCHCFYSCWNR